MHLSSFNEMREVLAQFAWKDDASRTVLDVGSMSVNRSFPHTYRELMRPNWVYHGADIAAGANVDIVMPSPYVLPVADASFDMVVSGQCLEHVAEFWRLAPELGRVLRVGGLMILTAPNTWPEHRYPQDFWRFMPDGMGIVLRLAACEVVTAYTHGADTWGVGRRVK